MRKIKVVNQTSVSVSYNIASKVIFVLDIVPLLGALFTSFVIVVFALSLLAPEVSNFLTMLDLPYTNLAFLIDLRAANLGVIVSAFLFVPTILLVYIRESVSSPPKSYLGLLWTVIIALLAYFVLQDMSESGRHFNLAASGVENGEYLSFVDKALNLPGIEKLAIDSPFRSAIWMFLMAFYMSTLSYVVLAFLFLVFFILGKISLRAKQKKSFIPLKLLWLEAVKAIKLKELLKLSFIVFCILFLWGLLLQTDRFYSEPPGSYLLRFIRVLSIKIYENQVSNEGFIFGAFALIPGSILISLLTSRLVFKKWRNTRLFITIFLGFFFFVFTLFLSFKANACTSLLFHYKGHPTCSLYSIASNVMLGISMFFFILMPILGVIRFVVIKLVTLGKLVMIRVNKATRIGQQKFLLLRPFRLDRTLLKTRRPLLSRLLPVSDREISLEEVISQSAYHFAPLVAVGKPGEKEAPLGAIREYLSDNDWQPFVKDEIRKAKKVVFIMGSATYTKWETEQVVANDAIDKLVLVVPPNAEVALEYFDANQELAQMLGSEDVIRDNLSTGKVRCIFRKKDSTVLMMNRGRKATDYALALDYAFAN